MMLRFCRVLFRVLYAGNWLAAVAFAGLIVLLVIRPELMIDRFGPRWAEGGHLAQVMLAIGIGTAAAMHVIFVRLIAMIDTVAAGHPFTAINGRRLRDVAWALLAIQLLDLAFGGAVWALERMIGTPSPWSFGVTGWLAVLMLFVLARVFAQGAAMQDELAATV